MRRSGLAAYALGVALLTLVALGVVTFTFHGPKRRQPMAEALKWIKVPIVQDATETDWVNLQGGKIIRVQTSGDNGWTGSGEWIGVQFQTRDSTTYGPMGLPVIVPQVGRPGVSILVEDTAILNTGPMIAPGWTNPDVGAWFPINGAYAQGNLGSWYGALYPYNWVKFTIMDNAYAPTPIANDDGTNFILLLVAPPEDAPKPFEPMGAGYQVIDVQFADNTETSPLIDLGDSRIVGVQLPSEWTSTELTFIVMSVPGVAGGALYDYQGAEFIVTTAPGSATVVYLDPAILAGFRHLYLYAGSQTNGAQQQADEPLVRLIVRPV